MALSKEEQERYKKRWASRNSTGTTTDAGGNGTTGSGASGLSESEKKRYQDRWSRRYDLDQTYLDTFFNDSSEFLKQVQTDYNKLDYKSATAQSSLDYYNSLRQRENDLKDRAWKISNFLNTRKDDIDEETYKNFSEYLKNFYSPQFSQQFFDARDYYSQFETEDAYNQYVSKQKSDEEKKNANLGALKTEIDSLENVFKEAESIVLNSMGMGGDDEDTRLQDQILGILSKAGEYSSMKELEKAIAEKRKYYTEASRMQEGLMLASVADPTSANYDPDFAKYSGYAGSTWIDNGWDRFWSVDDTAGMKTGYDDIRYDYINDPDAVTDYLSKGSNADLQLLSGLHAYSYMTKDQVAIYNYYYATGGKEAADKYLDSIQETLNSQQGNQLFSAVKGKPVLEYAFGVGAGLDQFGSGLKSLFSDQDYIPTTPTQYASGMIREDLKDTGFKLPGWLGGASAGQSAYDLITTGANMAPSILTSIAVGAINPAAGAVTGNALMGASAAGNAYASAINNGYDKGSARFYAASIGAAEAALGQLIGGISKLGGITPALSKALSGIDNGIARFALEYGGKMVSEGIEEGLQEILDPILQNAILHADEEINWSEVAYSALLGSLSAGVMEGPGTVVGAVTDAKLNKDAVKQYGAFTGDLIKEGLQSDANSESYQLAKKFQQQTQGEDGKAMTGRQIRQLVNANEAQFAVEDYNSAVDTAKEKLTALGETKDVGKVAELVAKKVTGQELTRAEIRTLVNSFGSKVAKEMETEYKQAESTAKAYEARYKSLTDRVGENGRFAVSESGETTVRGKDGAVTIAEITKIEDDQVIVKLENGEEVDAGYIDFASGDESLLYSAVADIERISPAAATSMVQNYDASSGVSVTQYVNGIDEAYTFGRSGYSVAELKAGTFTAALTEEQMMQAYELGKQAKQTAIEADEAKHAATEKSSATVSKKEKVKQQKDKFASDAEVYFMNGKDLKKFDEAVQDGEYDEKRMGGVNAAKMLSRLGIGKKYVFYKSYINDKGKRVYKDANGVEKTAPNGIYMEDGTIYIDLNAGNAGQGTTLYTLGHELTHFVKAQSEKQFQTLADLVTEAYDKTDMSMHQRVVEKQNQLSEIRGEHVTYDEAYEEVVADAMSTMISDGSFFEKLTEIKVKDKGLFNTIKKFFQGLIAKFKEAYATLSPEQKDAQDIQDMKDMFDKIQTAFAEALVEANDNFQAAEAQKNTTEDGGVNQEAAQRRSERIVDQIRSHLAEIMALDSVYTINSSNASPYVADLKKDENSGHAIFKAQGGVANRPGFGRVVLGKKGAVSTVFHGNGPAKQAAFPAIKSVIEQGVEIGSDSDHNGKGFGTVTFAAPINFFGTKAPLGVVVKVSINGRGDKSFYIHEICDAEGNYIELADGVPTKKEISSTGLVDSSSTAGTADEGIAPKNNIANNGKNVKNKSTEEVGMEVDENTESVSPAVMYSERTWTESEYVQQREKAAQEIANAIGVSVKKAKDYIDSVNSIAKMIAEDRSRLDYFSSPNRSSFVDNSEYGGSFDFSTLCKKRRLLTGTFTAIQKALPNTALTADEILDIRNRMKDKGLEVSCGLCYVEGSRANMGQFAKEFLRLYKQYYPDAWQPNMADVNTPDGIEWVRINHPECYEQYEYFWNHYGTLKEGDKNLFASQQKPKLYQLHTEYKGEILQKFKNDDKVEDKNINGGIRLQSFSDFEIVHLIDTMQIIMDMSRVGLAGQAYTKVPDFAWALGDTGLKINLSLIAKGVDANGKLIFDDVEGMPIADAMKLRERYSMNVGTILVAFNDEQLLAAMADERVDFIIPFHRSQWKKSQYEAMGLPAKTKDYTFMQNEKFIKPQFHEYRGRMVKDKATNYMPNEYWDFSKSGKENAEAYLEMCARNNKRPKFYKLLQNNGDGSYSLKADGSTDGYWKLLIDFKMYDNDGNGSPQMPVKPDFNMEEASRMMETYKGGHSIFPVAQGVVDEFVNDYKKSHKGAKFSERDDNTMSDRAREILASAKPKMIGKNEQASVELDTVRELFNELNSDKDIQALADKVFEVAKKDVYGHYGYASYPGEPKSHLRLPMAFVGKYGIPNGVHGQFRKNTIWGDIIFSYEYFMDENVTPQSKASTILHEVIHAVTCSYIENAYNWSRAKQGQWADPIDLTNFNDVDERIKAGIELIDVFEQVKYAPTESGKQLYGQLTAYEMVAEMANVEFRNFLKKQNLWNRIVDAIKRIFGIPRTTAYDAVSDALERILATTTNDADAWRAKSTSAARYSERVIPTGIALPHDVKVDKNGKPYSAEAQRNAGYMLSENKFYQFYSAHKLTYGNRGGAIDAVIEKIKRGGFISSTSIANVLPTSTMRRFDYDKNGDVEFANVVQAQYAPRKGEYVLFVPNNEVTKDDIIKNGFKPLDYEIGRVEYDYQPYYEVYANAFNKAYEKSQARFSERTNVPVFYSQMGKVVEGMKQEKFGASSVISMLRGRGVKAEEIRWSGIQAFLDGKKSVTKAELLEFIKGSMLNIEEKMLDGTGEKAKLPDNYRLEETTNDMGDPMMSLYIDGELVDTFEQMADDSIQSTGDSNIWAMDEADLTGQILSHYAGMSYDDAYGVPKETKWGGYKLDGGTNYRELLFKMPGVSISNGAMEAHWGKDASGVLAHARMQDFDVNGKKMLFIEEIQSDWHNAGHKHGYMDGTSAAQYEELKDRVEIATSAVSDAYREFKRVEGEFHKLLKDFGMASGDNERWQQLIKTQMEKVSMASLAHDHARQELVGLQNELQKLDKKVPDAPFKDNYHEFVLKRLIRMAAEEGYDSICWTTADIQSKRWSEDYAEGYRIEYDQDIPKFLRKYGKQWGAEVGKTNVGAYSYDIPAETEVPAGMDDDMWLLREEMHIEEPGTEVWSMDITPAMKKSVLEEGQALYSERTGEDVSNRSLLANAFEGIVQNSVEYGMIQEYKEHIQELNKLEDKLHSINDEIYKMRFTAGARDAAKLQKLESEAKEITKEINRYDKRLLNLEASEPLRKVIERERKKASQKTREHVTQILQNKKARAEQAELRHKIRKAVRDLDKILNRGNKKQNVKEDMKGFVSKALELADYLFTDHISDDDIIRKGIDADLIAASGKAQLVKETEDILTKIYDQADSLTDEEFTRLDAKRKANEVKLRDLLTAQRNKMLNTPVYQLFNDLVIEYSSFANSKQEAVKAAYDPKVEEFLRSYVGAADSDRAKALQNMRVADMTTEELWKLHNAYQMVLHSVRTANKLFVNGKTASIEQMVTQIVTEFGSRQIPDKKMAIALQKLGNKIGWDYEKLYYALDRIGSDAFAELIMNLANSENIVMQDIMEAVEFRDQMVEKYGFNNWDVGKQIDREFLDNTGKKFTMTLGQLMSLYAYSRRDGAWDHIEYGGFVFGEAALTNPKPADSYKLSKENCESITGLLTKEQKGYVEDMQKFLSETMGGKGNEVSMLLYGIKMFGEKNYFPIHIAGQFKAQAQESQAKAAEGFQSMSNAGFTHAQNPNAKAPFVLEGFNEVWSDHVNEMSRYHGTVPALEDIRRVMNRSSYSENTAESTSVKVIMENHFGKEAVQYFDNLYREANSGAINDKLQRKSKKLLSLFRKNSVAYSLSVLVQQPASIVRAYAMIDRRHFGFKGVGTITSGVAKAVTSKWNKAYANAYNEMLKYAPGVTMTKEIGGFDTATGGSIRSHLLDTGKSFKQKWKTGTALEKGKAVLDVVDDNAIANLPNVADKIAWIEIWNACKRETVAKHKDLKPNSEEFMQAVGERFTEVIRATQVYDSIFAKSPMLKSKNLAVQMLVSFMNEPNTVANMAESALRDLMTKGNRMQGLRTAHVLVHSIIFTGVLKSLVYAMRDDDEDETYIEKYIESLTGSLMDDFNPLNYIPIARDVWSVAQGYDVERADMAIVSDAIGALNKVIKAATSDRDDLTEDELIELDKKVTEASWNLVESLAAFAGIPVKNIRREINALIDHARIAKDNAGKTTSMSTWDSISEAVIGSIPFMSGGKSKIDKLYAAIMAGDQTYVDRIKATYKDEAAYHSAVRKALRENDARIKEAAMAQINGDPSERVRIAKQIIADIGKEYFDDVISAINSEISALTKDDTESESKVKGIYNVADFVTEMANGDNGVLDEIRDDIISTSMANGKTKAEAEESFVSGIKSAAKESYLAGALSDAQAQKLLREYADMDESEASERVRYWAFQRANPDVELTEAKVNGYYDYAEPAGISVDVYAQYVRETADLSTIYDEWGDELVSKREQVLDVIDSLPLTWQQKDALYLAAGYSESTMWDVPW